MEYNYCAFACFCLFVYLMLIFRLVLSHQRIELLKKINIHSTSNAQNRPAVSPPIPKQDSKSVEPKLLNKMSINSEVVPIIQASAEQQLPQELKTDLKRQGMTLNHLLTDVPSIAVQWKSVRDVSQCSSCSSPIAFLSRKVEKSKSIKYYTNALMGSGLHTCLPPAIIS